MWEATKCYIALSCKQYGKEICSSMCPMYIQLDFLFKQSQVPKMYIPETILRAPECDYHAFMALKDFKDNIKTHVDNGNGLMMLSTRTGNGKTTWAVKILKQYFRKVALSNDLSCRGLFINVPEFFMMLRDAIDNQNDEVDEILENIKNADLVIWDDIGTEKSSAWVKEKLYVYINSRISNCKTNIFTTNVNLATLKDNIGTRTVSRILGQCGSNIYEFKGIDVREAGDI